MRQRRVFARLLRVYSVSLWRSSAIWLRKGRLSRWSYGTSQYTTNLTNSFNEVAKRPNCFLDTSPKTELEKLFFFYLDDFSFTYFRSLFFFFFFLFSSASIYRYDIALPELLHLLSIRWSRFSRCSTAECVILCLLPPGLDYLPLCPIAIFPLSIFLFILLFYTVRLPFVSIMGDSKMFSFSFSGVQAMCFEFDVYFVVCRTIIKRKKLKKTFFSMT